VKERTGISFGGSLKWLAEDRFAAEMSLSKRNFRKLCRNLGVPMLEVQGTRLVCLPMFEIAMYAISRIGQPDFLTPGCETLSKNRASQYSTTVLDPHYLASEWEQIVAEMVKAKSLKSGRMEKSAVENAREAGRRLAAANVHLPVSRAMLKFSREAMKEAG
jgi:hypothetical protein